MDKNRNGRIYPKGILEHGVNKKFKKYIIDIDGTICNTTEAGYEFAKPLKDRIKKFNKIYDRGHYITYWTARGTTTGIDWRELTEKQLKEWGVKYHVLNLKKPEYDFWIDDKCVNPDEFSFRFYR
tara:strand:- start:53553 stop:53927 length:375 start_codon:yes stop_codon:yes gene_type:complete